MLLDNHHRERLSNWSAYPEPELVSSCHRWCHNNPQMPKHSWHRSFSWACFCTQTQRCKSKWIPASQRYTFRITEISFLMNHSFRIFSKKIAILWSDVAEILIEYTEHQYKFAIFCSFYPKNWIFFHPFKIITILSPQWRTLCSLYKAMRKMRSVTEYTDF